MGLREKIYKSPVVAGTFGVVVLVGASIAIWLQLQGPKIAGRPSYYTTDDGATYFEDDPQLIIPVDRNGKTVVRAYVFQCTGQKPFVGFMEKYPPDMKAVLEKLKVRKPSDPPPTPQELAAMMMPKEIKRPGVNGWNRETTTAAVMRVLETKCPDGQPPTRLSE